MRRKGIDSFIKGMGSVIQLFPEPIKLEDINLAYSEKYPPAEQDARALAEDWKNIGQDMDYALEELKEEVLK